MLHAAAAVLLPGFPEESTTCAVKPYVDAVVGVPTMAPVDPVRFRFGGSEPLAIE
jgi:hypothetical protein